MGLLNHVFGGKRARARELAFDEQKRLLLWQRHIADYPRRESLSRGFNFANVDRALADWNGLLSLLGEIESLISKDFVDIADEEKVEAEILADLKAFTVGEKSGDPHKWHDEIVETLTREKALLNLFKRIHDVLKLELHAISLLRKRPANAKDLLGYLFRLIFHQEAFLYRALREENFIDREIYEKVNKAVMAILLGQELEKEVRSDEQKFVDSMVRIMGNSESSHSSRRLAEGIYAELAERAGAPLARDEDIVEGIRRLEVLMKDDALMFSIVRSKRPRYGVEMISWVVKAFRKAYDMGHLLGLEAEFIEPSA